MKYIESFPHEHQLRVLDETIKRTFQQLHCAYLRMLAGQQKSDYRPSGTRLIFPQYRDSEIRVSEQELRFLFVEQLQNVLVMEDWCYSVETPTILPYLFSRNGKKTTPRVDKEEGKSAMIDLTVHDHNNERVALFEFKANNPEEFSFEKDFCKLTSEPVPLTFFVMVVSSANSRTKESIRRKVQPHIAGSTTLFYCYDLQMDEEILQDLRLPALEKLREMPGEHF